MEHSTDRGGSRGGPLAWPVGVLAKGLTTGPLTGRGALNGPLRGPLIISVWGVQGNPPRFPKRPVEVLRDRWSFRPKGLGPTLLRHCQGHLDGCPNGPCDPAWLVQWFVQMTLCPKLLVLAFSYFVSCPKVRGITISPPWDHSSSNEGSR